MNACVAYLLYARGQCDLAITQHRYAIDLDPGWYFPHWFLAIAYQHLGLCDEEITEEQQACEFSGRNAPALGILGLAYGMAGRRSDAKNQYKAVALTLRVFGMEIARCVACGTSPY